MALWLRNFKVRTSTLNQGLFLTCETVIGELDLTWSYMKQILFEANLFKHTSKPKPDNVVSHTLRSEKCCWDNKGSCITQLIVNALSFTE